MNIEPFLNRLETRHIKDCDGNPYLTRWYLLRTKWLGIWIHKFHRSDEDRAAHDHPFSFLSIILTCGYWEWVPNAEGVLEKTWYPPGSILFRRAEHQHRIEVYEDEKPFTLIFRFRRRRDWGFWTETGFIQWQNWWRANCE